MLFLGLGEKNIQMQLFCKLQFDWLIHVNERGHSKNTCRSQRKNKKCIHMINDSSESDDDPMYIKTLERDINSMSKSDDVIKIIPLVNSVSLEIELDTGAAVSLITEKIFMEKFPSVKMKPSDIVLKTYTGERMKPVCVADVDVKYQKRQKNLKLYVVRKAGVTLFGRDWLKHITLNWPEIKAFKVCKTDEHLKTVLEKHASVFNDDWGTLKGIKAKSTVKPDAQPKFVKTRQVPYALKPKVEVELDKLVNLRSATLVNGQSQLYQFVRRMEQCVCVVILR